MSDSSHIVPRLTLDQLADEVRVDHRSKFKRRKRVNPRIGRGRKAKYRNCEYVKTGSMNIRLLTDGEIAELQGAVERISAERVGECG